MNVSKITKYFIFVMVVLIIAYDLWALYKGKSEATISYILNQWGVKSPPIVLFAGYLLGHLWPISARFKQPNEE